MIRENKIKQIDMFWQQVKIRLFIAIGMTGRWMWWTRTWRWNCLVWTLAPDLWLVIIFDKVQAKHWVLGLQPPRQLPPWSRTFLTNEPFFTF